MRAVGKKRLKHDLNANLSDGAWLNQVVFASGGDMVEKAVTRRRFIHKDLGTDQDRFEV